MLGFVQRLLSGSRSARCCGGLLGALGLALLLVAAPAPASEEDEMMGFLVDDSISHIGHEFYRYFSDRMRDTSRLDFNLVIRERPDARWGSLIIVEYEQRVVYRRFLPPNTSELRAIASEAADLVKQQIVRRKLEAQLQDNTDLEKDEL
ncbi:curli production assembly/transport protein CsgE [Pseudomonas jinjuensis]|uniref:Curli production assembly/transport component CsgE n=1 Tax=Pseudomonas jinjuensis TaxID=198616 RepID=A0A1G9Z5V9_9PSED|nr:curli production assembly/transport protein CsgE [Pseudomonas jinjuensis]SDN16769.1 curli production assembly/transport component CsgE [Pseudomonas jinjuensis]